MKGADFQSQYDPSQARVHLHTSASSPCCPTGQLLTDLLTMACSTSTSDLWWAMGRPGSCNEAFALQDGLLTGAHQLEEKAERRTLHSVGCIIKTLDINGVALVNDAN